VPDELVPTELLEPPQIVPFSHDTAFAFPPRTDIHQVSPPPLAQELLVPPAITEFATVTAFPLPPAITELSPATRFPVPPPITEKLLDATWFALLRDVCQSTAFAPRALPPEDDPFGF
jgi:hypothetical protein